MDVFMLVVLFAFGAAIGSFVNVIASRYDGEQFLLSTSLIGGRSHCDQCKKTLRWFELVPLISFLIQGGKCRRCKARLGLQYPLVELISGVIFLSVPFFISSVIAVALWIAVFEALLVMALIDIRLGIIPDEISIFLGAVGVFLIIFGGGQWSTALADGASALGAGVFFALLIAITRGKGMGVGDLKLSVPLGLIFGWPGTALLLVAAFVIGAIFGIVAVMRGANSMSGTLPFGPFLALGAATAFFWGAPIIGWYLSLLGVR